MSPDLDVLLGGRYRLTARIAGGGMGEVWRAQDEVLGREVAVKILRREYADDATFLQRFRAEARHTAGLSHGGIAAVYDYGEDEGAPYLVMELVPGEPLSAVISREGALSPERTLDIVGQAALALQEAHLAGLIHRDVKPGNLLLTPDGTVKITDFGIARARGSVPLTQTGAIMGTAYYISPEQASGGSVTPASDIYSLGVVAYECLSGRPPFAGDTPVGVALAQVREEPPALPPGVPAPVRDLVMRMLAKDPAARPGSAGELGREARAVKASAAAVAAAPATTLAMPVVDADAAGTAGAAGTSGAAGGSGAAETATQAISPVPAHDRAQRAHDGQPRTDPGLVVPTRRTSRRTRRTSRRRLGWAPLAAAAVLAALLLLLLVKACASDPTAGTHPAASASSAPPPTTSAPPAVVTLVESDFVGRPADEVRAELERMGMRVALDAVPGDRVGTVRSVSPVGGVSRGTEVTVTVVRAGDSGSSGNGSYDGAGGGDNGKKHKGKGKGDG